MPGGGGGLIFLQVLKVFDEPLRGKIFRSMKMLVFAMIIVF